MPWPIRDLLTMKQELVEFALGRESTGENFFSRYGTSENWVDNDYQSKPIPLTVNDVPEHPLTIFPVSTGTDRRNGRLSSPGAPGRTALPDLAPDPKPFC